MDLTLDLDLKFFHKFGFDKTDLKGLEVFFTRSGSQGQVGARVLGIYNV